VRSTTDDRAGDIAVTGWVSSASDNSCSFRGYNRVDQYWDLMFLRYDQCHITSYCVDRGVALHVNTFYHNVRDNGAFVAWHKSSCANVTVKLQPLSCAQNG